MPLARPFYRKRHRITTADEFAAVFNFKARKSRGPITIFVMPNTHQSHRLGLSIGKRAGNAVTRNKIKRLTREAFRHSNQSLPKSIQGTGYDIVVTVSKHNTTNLQTWQSWYDQALDAAIRVLQKKTINT